MLPDLGDISAVWTPWRTALGFCFGFGFGYLVIASILVQPRWRTENSRRAYAWLIGVIAAWFLAGLAFVEAIGAALDGDGGWIRVISRLLPHVFVALGVGLGVWRGFVRAENRR